MFFLRFAPWAGIVSIVGAAGTSFALAGSAWMYIGFAELAASRYYGWLGLGLGLICRLSFAAYCLTLSPILSRADPGASRGGASGKPSRGAFGARIMGISAITGAISLIIPRISWSEEILQTTALTLALIESLGAGIGFAIVTYWIRARKDMAEEGVYARASFVGYVASIVGAWGGSLIGSPATGAIGYLAALSLCQWAAYFSPKLIRKLSLTPNSSSARP